MQATSCADRHSPCLLCLARPAAKASCFAAGSPQMCHVIPRRQRPAAALHMCRVD